MSTNIDLATLAPILGPQIAEGAAERDQAAQFVSENYELLTAIIHVGYRI